MARSTADRVTPMTKSGFCCIGHCEGTKPKGAISGTPMKTCEMSSSDCDCKCHKDIDKLFEMMGRDRLVQPNPEYAPAKRTWWMPTAEERALSSSGSTASPPRLVESPAPDVVPPTIERAYGPTATGRAGRGQLEGWVKRTCDIWLVEQEVDLCTVSYLSREIGRVEGIAPPSQGAIGAVLDRWTALGFAETAHKPRRFVKYTDEGVRVGLDAMKIRNKEAAARRAAAANRGVR